MGSGLSFQTFFDEVFANNKIALEKIRTKQSATMCFKAVYDIYDTNKKEYIKQGETSLTCPTVKIQR
ncbi:MAG: hypothetical protein PHO23_03005 [Candidatus Pacebacteria bacterium]|nr:hypothetical protein [Candidatus Paceibacterota bacterium]